MPSENRQGAPAGDPPDGAALLRALVRVAVGVQRARTVQGVLDQAAQGLHSLGFHACAVRFGDPLSQLASVRTTEPIRELLEPLVGRLENLQLRPGELGLPHQLLEEARPRLVEDVDRVIRGFIARHGGEPPADVGPLLQAAGIGGLVVAPLIVDGAAWGALVLAAPRVRSDDLAALSLFGAQVASALEVAQSMENLERQNVQLEAIHQVAMIGSEVDHEAVVPRLLGIATQATDSDTGSILLLDEETRALSLAGAVGYPDQFTRLPLEALLSGSLESSSGARGLSLEDWPERHRAGIAGAGLVESAIVPLVVNGRLGGWVHLSRRRPRRYTEDELRFASRLVAQIALQLERARLYADAKRRVELASAIDKARLYEEQRRRVRQLRLLLENSQVITGSLELEQILAASAQGLVGMIDATDAFIWFLEDTQLRGVVCSAREFQEHFARQRLSLSEMSAVGLAIQTRAPVRIEDTSRSPDVHRASNSVYRQKSVLALPLMLRELPIGAISIGDRHRTRRFSDDELERALLMSRQLAVAIDNARLFQDLKRSYTELSRAQQELVKQERLAALGELSAVVAHEVRNPLGVIFNSLASLRRLGSGEDDARMLLSIVGEEAERLNRMVSDLLDFARPHEPQLRPEPLSEILSGAVEAARRSMPAGQVTFAVEVEPELPPIWVDAELIRQAMVNLVMNAAQAMPRGGAVTVRAGPEIRGMARYARVEVQDDGPGIDPELADRVFQPFFTTKAAGTGLGLAVVKRIADAHRAEVAVRSTPGRGSTFILWLPA
jgi:two-component system sensor histidine kinase HydH